MLVDSLTCLSLRDLQLSEMEETEASKPSLMLWELAGKCVGLSGRSVRKISMLALALFSPAGEGLVLSLTEFVTSLGQAADRQLRDREQLTQPSS